MIESDALLLLTLLLSTIDLLRMDPMIVELEAVELYKTLKLSQALVAFESNEIVASI